MTVDLSQISRWTWRAFSTLIEEGVGGQDVQVWFDGDDAHSSDWVKWGEVYMGGPRWTVKSSSYQYFDAEILISLMCNEDLEDAHAHVRLRDVFMNILQSTQSISVFRDDDSYVGCYRFRRDVPRMIDGYDYSKPNSTTKIMRASIEGYYRMEIT